MRIHKKVSKTLETAAVRLSGMKSIGQNLDLGNGVSVTAYSSLIAGTDSALDTYNQALSVVDEKQNIFRQKEKELRNLNERVLDAVAAAYGKDSSEYEKMGGVRKSERKKPVKKEKKA
ncbi:MAG: hypothetical protein HY958_08755 [Bacteroidia bacterium]|nr:hypothetical protein [Bacteroidia bacterium]